MGGELKLRAGVSKILERDGTVYGVQLDSGEELLANQVLSSAGWHETLRLCDAQNPVSSQQSPPGLLTFIESISILNCQPSSLGYDQTIVFFNDSDTFHYERPRDELARCAKRRDLLAEQL